METINEQQHYIGASFLVDGFEGELRCMEPDLCDEWKFFDENDLPDDIFKSHHEIIKKYFGGILY